MAVDSAIRDAYRCALARTGQTVTFIRNVGVAPNITQASATVMAHVASYTPDAEVMARTEFSARRIGAITQGDRKIIVLADDLANAGFPVPLQKNDKAIVDGETLNVVSVDPNTRHMASAVELVVAGV